MTDSPHIGRPRVEHCVHSSPPCEKCEKRMARQREWNNSHLVAREQLDGVPYYPKGVY